MAPFTFSDFSLRPLREDDRAHLARCIAADPYHKDTVTPEFFLQPGKNAQALVLERSGYPIFYFKQEPAMRLHIQFGLSQTPDDREANRQALQDGFCWLRATMQRLGFRELIFESVCGPLIRFAEKRLGFRHSAHEMVCSIAVSEAQQGNQRTEQQASPAASS